VSISTDKYMMGESQRSPSEQRFLCSALELFSEKGYEGTSVRQICDLAGITRPSLYHFFNSKEGIYRALIEDAAREFQLQIERGLAQGPTLRQQFKQIARNFFHDARERARLWRFMFGLVWSTPRPAVVDELFHHTYCRSLQRLGQAVEEAMERGEVAKGDVRVRLLVLMGSLGEALSGFLIAGQPELTDELADVLIDTIFEGWGPPDRDGRSHED
jgi:AcrR family transcriptional regulator